MSRPRPPRLPPPRTPAPPAPPPLVLPSPSLLLPSCPDAAAPASQPLQDPAVSHPPRRQSQKPRGRDPLPLASFYPARLPARSVRGGGGPRPRRAAPPVGVCPARELWTGNGAARGDGGRSGPRVRRIRGRGRSGRLARVHPWLKVGDRDATGGVEGRGGGDCGLCLPQVASPLGGKRRGQRRKVLPAVPLASPPSAAARTQPQAHALIPGHTYARISTHSGAETLRAPRERRNPPGRSAVPTARPRSPVPFLALNPNSPSHMPGITRPGGDLTGTAAR